MGGDSQAILKARVDEVVMRVRRFQQLGAVPTRRPDRLGLLISDSDGPVYAQCGALGPDCSD